jgi:sulfatase maturation enzyme AslB (radical SAM superfamily)
MRADVARQGIDSLIRSPGVSKLLALYGGDPFLEFPLIKEMTLYARELAQSARKKCTISVCTNLTVLTDEQIDFIKKHDLKITVSLVGPEKIHDKYRYFLKGAGTYKKVIHNFRHLADCVPKQNLIISYVVLPSTSHLIFDNFVFLLNLGLSSNFNLEIIQDFEEWTETAQANFVEQLDKIIELVLKEMDKNNFIFIKYVTRELVFEGEDRRASQMCPFFYQTELYPSGEMAFSPFLLNHKDKDCFVIGNLDGGLKERYQRCRFNQDDPRCRHCLSDYFRPLEQDNELRLVQEYYALRSQKAARFIQRNGKAYVAYCQKHLLF